MLLYGKNFDYYKAKVRKIYHQKEMTFIPPFDHTTVISGQGTLAMELFHQKYHIDRFFVPAGVAIKIKKIMPHIQVIGVEAEEYSCFRAALYYGHPVNLSRVGFFADGVAVKKMGEETFFLCSYYLYDVITVDNDAICAAEKYFYMLGDI